MYKIHCRTNLDDFKRETWPTKLFHRPLIGESIESRSGSRLKIVSVTHLFNGELSLELHR